MNGKIKSRKLLSDQSLGGTRWAVVTLVGQRIGETGAAGLGVAGRHVSSSLSAILPLSVELICFMDCMSRFQVCVFQLGECFSRFQVFHSKDHLL